MALSEAHKRGSTERASTSRLTSTVFPLQSHRKDVVRPSGAPRTTLSFLESAGRCSHPGKGWPWTRRSPLPGRRSVRTGKGLLDRSAVAANPSDKFGGGKHAKVLEG